MCPFEAHILVCLLPHQLYSLLLQSRVYSWQIWVSAQGTPLSGIHEYDSVQLLAVLKISLCLWMASAALFCSWKRICIERALSSPVLSWSIRSRRKDLLSYAKQSAISRLVYQITLCTMRKWLWNLSLFGTEFCFVVIWTPSPKSLYIWCKLTCYPIEMP